MEMALPKEIGKRTQKAVRAIEWLEGRFEMWGKPRFDIKSEIFWEMMFDVIKVWQGMYPTELKDWIHDRKIDLAIERPLKESSKSGIKKSMAYPPTLFKMIRQYWPDARMASRSFTRMFRERYPIFKNSNWT